MHVLFQCKANQAVSVRITEIYTQYIEKMQTESAMSWGDVRKWWVPWLTVKKTGESAFSSYLIVKYFLAELIVCSLLIKHTMCLQLCVHAFGVVRPYTIHAQYKVIQSLHESTVIMLDSTWLWKLVFMMILKIKHSSLIYKHGMHASSWCADSVPHSAPTASCSFSL